MIIDQALKNISGRLGKKWPDMLIADLRIGLYLTAVKLSDGSAGVATTLENPVKHCKKENRRFGDFSPMHIKGQKVADLFAHADHNPVSDSLRLATLNALSSQWITNGNHRLHFDTDPIDLLDLSGSKHIVVVGAFQSYIRKILPTKNKLTVVELRRDALTHDQQHLFVPAADAHRVVPGADVVILTGMTLVNNTLDKLLELVTEGQEVVVTGPSSSILPEVLFANGVSTIGATLITDADKLLELAGQAGAGYHLFHYCARKVTIKKAN